MHDEHKPEGLFISHAIEDKHRLDGKMPGTSTIRCWHDDGKVGYDEGYQCTADTEVRREVEAEEGEVVMQEVHHPDADGEKEIERQVLDASQ